MSPKKLSDDEKKELIRLYCQTEQTTATLADYFQVSSSTVSRVLKNHLSGDEYANLIQQKRHNRNKSRFQETQEDLIEQVAPSPSQTTSSESFDSPQDSKSSFSHQQIELSLPSEETSQTSNLSLETDEPESLEKMDFAIIKDMFGEDVGDDDDLDDSEEDDWEEEEETPYTYSNSEPNEVEVLPLSQAKFPKTCYLVVDRGSNLITKPLKDFSDLGKIPSLETQQKTLPIFENHRVARRFSNRSQKVIKIPDGKMISKTKNQLEAKGIKRILMDGKVYTLS